MSSYVEEMVGLVSFGRGAWRDFPVGDGFRLFCFNFCFVWAFSFGVVYFFLFFLCFHLLSVVVVVAAGVVVVFCVFVGCGSS